MLHVATIPVLQSPQPPAATAATATHGGALPAPPYQALPLPLPRTMGDACPDMTVSPLLLLHHRARFIMRWYRAFLGTLVRGSLAHDPHLIDYARSNALTAVRQRVLNHAVPDCRPDSNALTKPRGLKTQVWGWPSPHPPTAAAPSVAGYRQSESPGCFCPPYAACVPSPHGLCAVFWQR
jgi:hypothetical protein